MRRSRNVARRVARRTAKVDRRRSRVARKRNTRRVSRKRRSNRRRNTRRVSNRRRSRSRRVSKRRRSRGGGPKCNQPGCDNESDWDGYPCDSCFTKTKAESASYQASSASKLDTEAAVRATSHQQRQADTAAHQRMTQRFHDPAGWDSAGQARASSGRYAGPRSAATSVLTPGPTFGVGR